MAHNLDDSFASVALGLGNKEDNIHGMPNQDAFIQFLLFDKLLQIIRHGTIIVLRSMERLAMVTQILFILV